MKFANKYLKELEIIAKVDSKNKELEFCNLGKELIEKYTDKIEIHFYKYE